MARRKTQTEKVETEKVETQKVETQKVETQKAEPKKVEPKPSKKDPEIERIKAEIQRLEKALEIATDPYNYNITKNVLEHLKSKLK